MAQGSEGDSVSNADLLRQEFFQTIREHAGSAKRNILFVGCRGVGKSSLINSLAAAVNMGKWNPIANVGGGGAVTTVSRDLYIYKSMGLLGKEDVPFIRLLPNFIDMSGLDELLTPAYRNVILEVLRAILYGCIPNWTSIEDLVREALVIINQHGIQGFRERYRRSHDDMKVYAVVFVAAADMETLPEELIKTVKEATQRINEYYTTNIPLFGVITKVDHHQKDPDKRTHFETNLEPEFIRCLQFKGVSKLFYSSLKNYCDDTVRDPTSRDPELEIPLLKLLLMMVNKFVEPLSPNVSQRRCRLLSRPAPSNLLTSHKEKKESVSEEQILPVREALHLLRKSILHYFKSPEFSKTLPFLVLISVVIMFLALLIAILFKY